MHPPNANGFDPRLSFWPRVREFAVPPSVIEAATARRLAGDWRGACDAAGFDVEIDLRGLATRTAVASRRKFWTTYVTWHPTCCAGTYRGWPPTDCCAPG